MSNTKHLADLLKVCSILPALAIMPAMASNDPNLSDNAFVLGDVVTNETIWGGVRIESDDPMVLAWPEYKMVARSFDLTGIKEGGKKVYFGPIDLTVRELADDEEFAWNSQRYDESGNPIDFDLAKYNKDGSERDEQVVWNNANGVKELDAMGRFLTRDDSKEAGKVTVTSSDVIMAGSKITAKEIVFNDSSLNIIKDLPELGITSDGVAEIVADELDVKGNSQIVVAPGTQLDIQASDIEIDVESGHAVCVEQQSVINIGTETAGEIEISAIDGMGVRAKNGAIVSVGNENTKSVDIESDGSYGVLALAQGAKVDIKGKNIKIATNADEEGAIHAGNNNPADDVATVNITGENIVIDAPTKDVYQGIGIGAMSWGIVNIEGNTTIRAQNAILARGDAQVNINKSGENTVKMLGDINFNYREEKSGSPVNATIDVNLVGEESFWKGNTVVSWDDVNPGDGKLEVSNAKIALKDGAVWNATKITDRETATKGLRQIALNDLVIDGGTVNIQDTERGIMVDRIVANDATFGGGMLNVNESIVIESGVTTFSGNVMGLAADTEKDIAGATLTLANGATMDIGTSTVKFDTMNIDGTVVASVTNGRPYGHLYGDIVAGEDALLKLNVGSVGTYKIFDDETNMKLDAGLAYNVKYNDEYAVVVETKAIEDLAKDAGISTQAAGAIAGLTMTQDPALQKVSLALQQVLNSGDDAMVAIVERETKKLNPTDKPVAQAAATSVQNQVLSLAAGRMAGGISVGRAGGDERSQENGFWAQGMFNKSKFADEFHGYTRGIALGVDTTIDKTWTVGGGLAFNNSDVHADGVNTDIDTKTMFLYGQYKPSEWFVNATATYSMSEYTENKTIAGVVYNDEYDVDSYGAQIMGGYDFATGITTEAGLRYLHIAQEAHSFAKELDTDFLTGVAGLKYAFAIENDWAIQLRPELRAAMTYDFISDEATATVVMPGVASYKVDAERLSRLGGEFGIGLTALYKGVEVSLMYDLDLHRDYTSQTGMIKFRGRF